MSNSAWNAGEIRKFKNQLSKLGFVPDRTNGSHTVYKNETTGQTIMLNRKLNKMVMRRLRKEVNGNGEEKCNPA